MRSIRISFLCEFRENPYRAVNEKLYETVKWYFCLPNFNEKLIAVSPDGTYIKY